MVEMLVFSQVGEGSAETIERIFSVFFVLLDAEFAKLDIDNTGQALLWSHNWTGNAVDLIRSAIEAMNIPNVNRGRDLERLSILFKEYNNEKEAANIRIMTHMFSNVANPMISLFDAANIAEIA